MDTFSRAVALAELRVGSRHTLRMVYSGVDDRSILLSTSVPIVTAVEAMSARDLRHHQSRVAERRQVHEERAVAMVQESLGRDLQAESRLAGTALSPSPSAQAEPARYRSGRQAPDRRHGRESET